MPGAAAVGASTAVVFTVVASAVAFTTTTGFVVLGSSAGLGSALV
jgi:hypothetical protein